MTQTAVRIVHTPDDLAGNILSFRRHLAAGNLSPTTIKTYSEAATKLAEFLIAYGMPTDVARIRPVAPDVSFLLHSSKQVCPC